ncbi:MAG: hypothetical protein ACRDZV_00920 [Acidimicrobiia bacterium]
MRLRYVVVVAAIVMTLGRVIDLRWHATHPEFETGVDQLQAHWLSWLGALGLLVVATIGMIRPYRSPGYVILFTSALLYAPVAVWHFWLHNQLRDPALPHALLAVSQFGLYLGTAFLAAGLVRPRCRAKYLSQAPA